MCEGAWLRPRPLGVFGQENGGFRGEIDENGVFDSGISVVNKGVIEFVSHPEVAKGA